MQIWWRRRRVARLFCVCEGGGGCVWAVKMQTVLGGTGGMLPGKFLKIWSALDCILRVLMVDKERNRI